MSYDLANHFDVLTAGSVRSQSRYRLPGYTGHASPQPIVTMDVGVESHLVGQLSWRFIGDVDALFFHHLNDRRFTIRPVPSRRVDDDGIAPNSRAKAAPSGIYRRCARTGKGLLDGRHGAPSTAAMGRNDVSPTTTRRPGQRILTSMRGPDAGQCLATRHAKDADAHGIASSKLLPAR